MHGAHIDEAAAPGLVHVRQAGPGRQERAVEMDRQHLLPLGIAEFLERMDDLNPGIADEHVDATECRNGLRDTLVHLRLVGDVHRDAEYAA